MEQLADLPLPALMTFGAVLAVIFSVRHLGLIQGQKSPPTAQAQVAAMIVDSTALNRATDAIDDLVEVLPELGKEIRELRLEMLVHREISRVRHN